MKNNSEQLDFSKRGRRLQFTRFLIIYVSIVLIYIYKLFCIIYEKQFSKYDIHNMHFVIFSLYI